MTALISLITILLIPTYTSTYIANFPEYLEKPQLTLFSNTQNDNENNLPTIETALS
ncbi:MAG: hypothetical protein LBD11_00755 [Candidatus Peribacteria bacterium]|nr:hypothetical protein [Candidatus Peribacteria bacterium]